MKFLTHLLTSLLAGGCLWMGIVMIEVNKPGGLLRGLVLVAAGVRLVWRNEERQ